MKGGNSRYEEKTVFSAYGTAAVPVLRRAAFAEMPLVMDTYTHTTETETYDPVKDNSSSSGSSTDSDGFGGSSGGKF